MAQSSNTTKKGKASPPPYNYLKSYDQFEKYIAKSNAKLLETKNVTSNIARELLTKRGSLYVQQLPMYHKHLIQTKYQIRDQYTMYFTNCVQNWHEVGVGPVRMYYYVQAIAPHDLPRVVDFPTYPHTRELGIPRFEQYLPLSKLEADCNGWLAQDAYLSDILAFFGLTWMEVEKNIFRNFNANLPQEFKDDTPFYNELLRLIYWQEDLAAWKDFTSTDTPKSKIHPIIRKINVLDKSIAKAHCYHTAQICISQLFDLFRLPRWMDGQHNVVNQHTTLQWSPITISVVRGVAKLLWDAAQKVAQAKGSKTFFKKNPVPSSLEDIFTQAEKGNATRADEFWTVVADLVYHLPLIRGILMPSKRNPPTDEAIRTKITALEREDEQKLISPF